MTARRNRNGVAAREAGPALTSTPAATLSIRRAGPGDLVPLGFFFDAILRKDYFFKRGQLQEILAGPYHEVYIAELDCVLVGVAILTSGTRLVNVLVHPAYRGLGIGAVLVRDSRAREVRVKKDISTGDPSRFYRALGFRSTGLVNDKGNIEVMRLERRANGAVGGAGRSAKSRWRAVAARVQ